MVRQVRRLECLQRLLAKQTLAPVQDQVARQDWLAICRCTAFGEDFLSWCMTWLDLGPVAVKYPTHEQVFAIGQLVRFHTDAALQEDRRAWLDKLAYDRRLDQRNRGSSKAFARLKHKQIEPLQQLHLPCEEQAIVHEQERGTLLLYLGNASRFSHHQMVQIDDAEAKILSGDEFSLIVEPLGEQRTWPHEASVKQSVVTTSTRDIMRELEAFWQSFWQVDHPDTTMEETLAEVLSVVPSDILPDDLDFYNDQLWLQAVKDLNSHSAKGLDCISASELQVIPQEAVLALRDVIKSDQTCFDNLMTATTHPVPKTQQPVATRQVRPITVLPQTYRLWQVHFVCVAADAGEEATSLCISIDLVKCFNTIKRPVAMRLLARLGAPPDIITRWQAALQSLKRTWTVNLYSTDPLSTNCGLPEGDALSVIGMLCVSFAWICYVEQNVPSASLLSYADNWGWHVDTPAQHRNIIECILTFASMCGMEVDWNKSWAWATTNSAANQLQPLLRSIPATVNVSCQKTATELGAQHTYGGPPRLGKLHDRLATGVQRLGTLQRMPHSFEVKTHLIKSGVYPAAFYGSELLPLGTAHTDEIRSAACSALLGPSPSRNSHVAMLCVPSLLDPELFVIRQAVLATRRFLIQASDQTKAQFLEVATQHSGVTHKCRGPAGALAHYLNRLSWTLDAQGYLHVDAFRKFKLVELSARKITDFLLHAWSADLLTLHSSRKAWRGHAPIHPQETQRVISSFDTKHHKALLNELSGAFQTASQQAKWDAQTSPECPYCGEHDTREHRIFSCAATLHVRDEHRSILNQVEFHGFDYHELPVITRDFDTEFFHTYCDHLAEPTLAETLHNRLKFLQDAGHQLRFFTDGSCQHPTFVDASHAAVAIVLDTTADIMERTNFAQHWREGDPTPCLTAILAARIPGEQTIHRAEIYALVLLCEHFHDIDVATDSQSALSLANKCVQLEHPRDLYNHSEPDLALRLWEAVREGRYNFRKVKAHTDIQTCADLLEKFDRIGPHMDSFVWGCKNLCERTDFCTGIEYSAGRCEIWKRLRGIFHVKEISLEKGEFTCLRYGWPTSKLVPVGPPGTSHPCRGKSRHDNHPKNYWVASGITDIEECKSICAARTGLPCLEWGCDSKCSGIEYSLGRCEIWKVEIESFNPNVEGYTCLKFNITA
eukprot:Skav216859  [mRNA]  locus=scaffold1042:124091:129630:- [translate_table: standard]